MPKRALAGFVVVFALWGIFWFWFSDIIRIRIFVRLKLFTQKLVNYFVTHSANALI